MRRTSDDPGPAMSEPVSASDVIRLAGDLDDETVVAVIATGATCTDVEQAVKWANGDAEELGKSGHPLIGASAAVFDILMASPAFATPDGER